MASKQHYPMPSHPLLEHPHDGEANAHSLVSIHVSHEQSQTTSGDEQSEKSFSPQKDVYQKQTSNGPKWWRLWWQEVCSMSLSLLCLSANIGVLAKLDQSPYAKWQVANVDITPNTIVSIIATLTKASLLLPVAEVVVQLKWLYFQARDQRVADLQVFDDASRGPLGSLRLLWRINLRVRIITKC